MQRAVLEEFEIQGATEEKYRKGRLCRNVFLEIIQV